jgi:mycothiol synthase
VTLEIRPATTEADLERYAAVVACVTPEAALTPAELVAIDNIEFVHLLAVEGDAAVGAGVGFKEPRMLERRGATGKANVLPEHRNRGIGSALYAALSNWARSHDVEVLETSISDADAESLAWAERRGFTKISRELCVQLDLTQLEPPPVDPPPGIEIVSWAGRPDLTRGMYEVAVEAFPDVPGYEDDEMETFDDWLEAHMRGPGDRPEATFIAVAGDEVVGYAKFSLTDAQPTVAYHDLTGVKRAWRGRGIAGALKRAEIAWAKQVGYERLSTTNEVRNEPIRRLNEQLGYRPAPGRTFLRGPLAPP